MDLDYSTVLQWRHSIQGLALDSRPTDPLEDEETEGDEMFQNAGAQGDRHQDPADPPRRRANKRRGRGTKDNDRPPILGIVGRRSQQLRLRVCQNTQQVTIQPQIENSTLVNTTLYTDESDAYNLVLATGHGHV